jgi:hypothetical protein
VLYVWSQISDLVDQLVGDIGLVLKVKILKPRVHYL